MLEVSAHVIYKTFSCVYSAKLVQIQFQLKFLFTIINLSRCRFILFISNFVFAYKSGGDKCCFRWCNTGKYNKHNGFIRF